MPTVFRSRGPSVAGTGSLSSRPEEVCPSWSEHTYSCVQEKCLGFSGGTWAENDLPVLLVDSEAATKRRNKRRFVCFGITGTAGVSMNCPLFGTDFQPAQKHLCITLNIHGMKLVKIFN